MERIKLTKRQIDIFKMWNEGLTQKEIARELEVSITYICKTLRIVFKRLGLELNKGVVSYARKDIEELKSGERWWNKNNEDKKEELIEKLSEMGINILELKEKVRRF